MRTAAIPGCGLAGIPARLFVSGLALGSCLDLALHFALGFAGAGLLATIVQASPIVLVLGLMLIGLAGWLLIARRRRMSRAVALNGWAQATCPVCLVLGSVNSLESEGMTPRAFAVR